MRIYLAEAIGTFALIFIGVGVMQNTDNLLTIALAHGLTIAVMVSAVGSISGGHLNPAVTFGAWVGGKISTAEAGKYWVAQLLGATLAGVLVTILFGKGVVILGTPGLSAKTTYLRAIAIEAVTTFFLVFVVYGTGIDRRGPKIGGLAIGLTVTIGILVAYPFTGGALNPARAFGPALASGDLLFNGWSYFGNHLVYWFGPLLGGALAGLIYGRYLLKD
ncbi:MAG: aquaporin [Verrucomicrobia bacterium Tous-C9LFEB]|nr:MAG: aquaporin [Verrucomicrobia bacterium Tous-C9LFEB]